MPRYKVTLEFDHPGDDHDKCIVSPEKWGWEDIARRVGGNRNLRVSNHITDFQHTVEEIKPNYRNKEGMVDLGE